MQRTGKTRILSILLDRTLEEEYADCRSVARLEDRWSDSTGRARWSCSLMSCVEWKTVCRCPWRISVDPMVPAVGHECERHRADDSLEMLGRWRSTVRCSWWSFADWSTGDPSKCYCHWPPPLLWIWRFPWNALASPRSCFPYRRWCRRHAPAIRWDRCVWRRQRNGTCREQQWFPDRSRGRVSEHPKYPEHRSAKICKREDWFRVCVAESPISYRAETVVVNVAQSLEKVNGVCPVISSNWATCVPPVILHRRRSVWESLV